MYQCVILVWKQCRSDRRVPCQIKHSTVLIVHTMLCVPQILLVIALKLLSLKIIIAELSPYLQLYWFEVSLFPFSVLWSAHSSYCIKELGFNIGWDVSHANGSSFFLGECSSIGDHAVAVAVDGSLIEIPTRACSQGEWARGVKAPAGGSETHAKNKNAQAEASTKKAHKVEWCWCLPTEGNICRHNCEDKCVGQGTLPSREC